MSTPDPVRAALREHADQVDVIDTHEHLAPEVERVAGSVDFYTLFSKYCPGDMRAAGMGAADAAALLDGATPVERKWDIFARYYPLIHDGSYARGARLAMEHFYGFPDVRTMDDALAVTRAIRAANTPGIYRKVLRDACRISTCMNFEGRNTATEFLTPVAPVGQLIDVASTEHLAAVGREIGTVSPTLAGYLDAIGAWLQRIKSLGTRGIKLDNAYRRELHFLDTPTADAERVYGRIWEESRGSRRSALGFDETRPLQDFLVHRLVEMAGGLDLAVSFHTGLQAGVENDLDLARPERLWNLAIRYKGTRFVLLHAGIPWTDEAAMMAKCFPNVWVDMAWTHLISPVLARRALFAWIDYVPRNKILGFGGDTRVVEGVYGYLSIAKQNMCDALARAVEEGRMGVADARGWIDSLLRDNPCEVYRLPGAHI